MKKANNAVAYHYTTGTKLREIASDGFLDPTKTVISGAGPRERPVLWFSTAEPWEPTACKAVSEEGKLRTLTMAETKQLGFGLVRFGYPVRRLHSWKSGKLARKARIEDLIANGLSKAGRDQGADPDLWYGACRPISLSEVVSIEVIDEHDNWQPVNNPHNDAIP